MGIVNFYGGLARPARIALACGTVLVCLLTALALWWVLAPRQQLLFAHLRESDAAEIVQALQEWKVPYTLVDGGTSINVEQEKVYDTRMRLVSAGIPKGGHVGFELFNDSDFGITEFAQQVNYQRALQGEIERTIAALPAVSDARVHLTIRRQGLFADPNEGSKGSVALSLLPEQRLSPRQINGIRSLVAASVEGLRPEQVSVLDSNGALLAGGEASGSEIELFGRGEQKSQFEQQLTTRIRALLAEALQNHPFAVTVDATFNYDAVHEVNERPLAQGTQGGGLVVRRKTSTEAAAEQAPRQQQEETEYVHGSSRQEINRAPGRLERLSVAVVVPEAIDDVQLHRLRALVAASAGMDFDRGDQLEVSRLASAALETAAGATVPPDMTVPAESVAPMPQQGAPKASGRSHPLRWILLGAAAMLAGAMAMAAVSRRPRRLTVQQREAMLRKLRLWLEEGQRS